MESRIKGMGRMNPTFEVGCILPVGRIHPTYDPEIRNQRYAWVTQPTASRVSPDPAALGDADSWRRAGAASGAASAGPPSVSRWATTSVIVLLFSYL